MTIDRSTMTWTVFCHGETEVVSVPPEFLSSTTGPFFIKYDFAFSPAKEEKPKDTPLKQEVKEENVIIEDKENANASM